jgi:TPR repeat protein
MNAKASEKMGKRVRLTYVAVLEALKAHNCISSYSITENDVQPKWEDGGIDRVVKEVTINAKPFGLNRSQRGGLLMVLPQKAREKADTILLSDFKKKYGLILMLLFLTLGTVSAQQTNSMASATNKVFADLRAKAESGDAQSQYELGVAFDFGKFGLEKDYAQSVKWFRLAAEQSNAAAQDNLGQCYAAGEGIAQDCAEAAKWYRKAAERNYVPAQYNLAVAYDSGLGVPNNDEEAIKWYRKVAEQDFAPAQFNLAQFYRSGRGVAKDEAEAAKWFQKAADQNFAKAEAALGLCYINGVGVSQDTIQAIKWYRNAAEQNDNSAQYDLGLCYANGEGVSKNYVEAYKWWTLAANQNNTDARKYLSVLSGSMSPDRIAEGQKLVHSFVPQKAPTVWVNHSDSISP